MSSKNDSDVIFFYGTLQRNQPNYYITENLINENKIQFMGTAKLKVKRPLIIASEFNLPYILDECDRGHNIIGEIYKLYDMTSLIEFDKLEKHPIHYTREICEAIMIDVDDKAKKVIKDSNELSNMNCWVYLLKDFIPELLNYEYLDHYTDGKLNKYYVLPSDRPENAIHPMNVVKKNKFS